MKAASLKEMPSLRSDKEAEDFVANSDLSEYDLSGFKRASFEFQPKTEMINLRLPHGLLEAVKGKARSCNLPYTRYIRLVLEQATSGQERA